MTAKEVAAFIVTRWRLEHTVEAIMIALVMQRAGLSRQAILAVIRAYCNACTENNSYQATRRG